MLKKMIGLSAPARSGKDTVASLLLHYSNVSAYALADPLKRGCQALFGLTDDETWNDQIKEKPIALWARSPREFFQHVGTDWMRAYNPEHWLMLAERIISTSEKENRILFLPLHDPKTPFKLAAHAFFNLSEEQLNNPHQENVIDTFWDMSPKQMYHLIESLTLKDFPHFLQQRSQRPIMQPVQNISFNNDNQVVLIKDIRFENEADFIRRHHGVIWHVIRHNAKKVNPHASEQGIQIKATDVIIDNNGTLEQLAAIVEQKWSAQNPLTPSEVESLNLND